MPDVEPLLTAREVHERFQFPSAAWVLRHARGEDDPLPSFRLGGTFGPVRFRASEIEAWLRKRSSGARRAS